jgi:hypothetical protein
MLQVGRWVAVHRFQQMRDVVAEVEAIEDLADEPRGRVIEDRHLGRAGVIAEETADDPALSRAIRAHAQEVTGFVRDGMPPMMKGMMGPGMMGPGMMGS